jgi:dihydrofolate synthase/folylpolyglutamate synthase
MLKHYLEWLSSYEFHGIKPGLARITKILNLLGNPHKKIKTIHIAGTNGKGSTAIILSEILKAHSLKVGLYTSPHLFRLNERFRINGEEISDKKLEDLLKRLKEVIKDFPVTYFEITTALAFLLFFEEKVDIAVIECGLGGRLDATNVIKPEVSIITTVGRDHTKYLGDTLEKIAFEKAGIMKREVPCVLGEINPELVPLFEKKAKKSKIPLFLLGRDFKVELKKEGWFYKGEREFKRLLLGLKGFYQGKNLACALKTLELLENKGLIKLEEKKLRKALKEVRWPGRYEKFVQNGKEILIDVAHNLQGIEALKETLEKENFKDFTLIMGISNEDGQKPFLKMLELFLPLASKIFLCEFSSPRKIVTLEEWKEAINKLPSFQNRIELMSSPEEAYKMALKEKNFRILITGSIYFVAQCLNLLKK